MCQQLYLIHWPVAFKPGNELFPKTSDGSELALNRDVSISQTWKGAFRFPLSCSSPLPVETDILIPTPSAMTELPKSKARSVGVSNFSIEHLEAVIKATGVVPAVNQVERHPRVPNKPLVDYCASKNIVITAYSAFGNNGWGVPLLVNTPEVKAVADRLAKAQGKDVTPAQVILAWSQLGGHVVIPKSVTASRIRENFQEVELDDEAIKAIDKLGEQPQRFNIPYTCTFLPLLYPNVAHGPYARP